MTLDTIARDPALAAALSTDERQALLVQIAGLLAILGATMRESVDQEPDTLLSVQDVAKRLRLSVDHVYRHAKSYPFFRPSPDGARVLRFSSRALDAYLRARQG